MFLKGLAYFYWASFIFAVTHHFCFFSLVLFVTFSCFYFLRHATEYWHSNVNKDVQNTLHCLMFSIQRSDEKPNVGWNYTQIYPTWKSDWMNHTMLDEKFHREQHVQQEFFLLLSFFFNFVNSQMHRTFCPTLKITMLGEMLNAFASTFILSKTSNFTIAPD